jgi:hypothetical protein
MPIKDKLIELRAVAERLPLGEAGDRTLRGLIVDFIDVLTGGDASHPDVNNSGARVAPPPPEHFAAVHPSRGAQLGPVGKLKDAVAPEGAPDIAGEDWLAAAEADIAVLEEKKKAAAAERAKPKAPAAPTPPNGGH